MRAIKQTIYFLLLFNFFCCMVGCGQQIQLDDLKRYVTETKKKQQIIEEEHIVAELKKPVPAVYSAKSSRIPFGETKALVNKPVSSNPLHAVPLNMLRFTGTVIEGKSIRAFILAPDNKVYSVAVGDTLGDREDKIIHIYPNKIELKEQTTGSQQGKIITLELNEGRQ